jgi:hypothetical protein
MPANLIVIKHVINNNGGQADASDFTMNVYATDPSDDSFLGNENGTAITLDAGSYYVSENEYFGYEASYSEDCNGTIANGETKDFPTTAGQHTVTAKIDWCSSPDLSINVNDNQTKTLKVGGFRSGQIVMPIGFGLFVLHFIFLVF